MQRILTPLFLLLAVLLASPAHAIVAPAATTDPATTEAEARAAVEAYRAELAAMSKAERRALKREQRKALKQAVRDHRSGLVEDNVLLLVIIAILLPPLAVFLHQGEINSKFWIALLLTLLFYLPGLIYALVTILG